MILKKSCNNTTTVNSTTGERFFQWFHQSELSLQGLILTLQQKGGTHNTNKLSCFPVGPTADLRNDAVVMGSQKVFCRQSIKFLVLTHNLGNARIVLG